MDTVQKPDDSECYTPSSEPFRLYSELVFAILEQVNEYKQHERMLFGA
jgi:hypothetical protein